MIIINAFFLPLSDAERWSSSISQALWKFQQPMLIKPYKSNQNCVTIKKDQPQFEFGASRNK